MMHIHQRRIKLNRMGCWNVGKFKPIAVKLNFESIGFSILICSLNEKAAMLSNYEVYQLLQETENQNKGGSIKKKQPKHLVNLSTISYEVSPICFTFFLLIFLLLSFILIFLDDYVMENALNKFIKSLSLLFFS